MVQTLPADEARGHEPLIGVSVQVFNRRMRKQREACGFSQYALADSIGIGRHRISLIETLRAAPTMEEVNLIATALYDEPSHMFPEEVRHIQRDGKASVEFYLTRDGLRPCDEIDHSFMLAAAADELLTVLTPRQAHVVRRRFGDGLTFEAISQELGCTRERARQVEASAMSKMRRAESGYKTALLEDARYIDQRVDKYRRKYGREWIDV